MSTNSLRKSIHHNLHISLRNTLIKARKDINLSQRDLAEKLGVTHSIIGKIETGDRRLDVIEFYEYAKALDLIPSETLVLLFHEHRTLGGGVAPMLDLLLSKSFPYRHIFIYYSNSTMSKGRSSQ